MGNDYTREKLHKAMMQLVSGEGDLTSRLQATYDECFWDSGHWMLHSPAALAHKAKVDGIRTRLATLGSLSGRERSVLARDFFPLGGRVWDHVAKRPCTTHTDLR